MHNSHFAAKKMKENVLNIEYHSNSLETSSSCVLSIHNHYSQLKKHLKVDPETRSYDFLTKNREKNPMSRNSTNLGTTSEHGMITVMF